jgi:hypothetical protein
MSTFNAMGSAIFGKLSAGTALTALLPGTASIYNMQARENATYPYVVFSLNAGGPLNITPSDNRELIYWIRCYSKVSAGQAGSIDSQVSNLLHKGSVSISGYSNVFVWREMDAELLETLPNTEPVWMCGGMYRFGLDA